MRFPIAQTSEAVQVGATFVDTAGSFGGAVWILSLVLLFISALIAFYTWKIGIPNATAHRENSSKLADAISAMGPLTSETHAQVHNSGQTIDQTQSMIRVMASCRVAECAALEKLAQKANVDVSAELGEIRGAYRAATEIAVQ